jgi:acylpyruvate hydrolase
MRLVTFLVDGRRRVGALTTNGEEQVVADLHAVDSRIPQDMVTLLAGGVAALDLAREALVSADPEAQHPLGSVTLQAPVPRPGKIICVGLNYRDHAAESKMPIPDYPAIFSKYANAIIGPDQPIVIPRVTDQVDYEGELAFVIGRRGRYIPPEQALAHVAGYMAFNDVSARDFQMRTSQWTIGKAFDGFAPTGPALVTADEIPHPHDLDLRVTIGGELLQSSNTRNLVFTVPDLVAQLSQVMTLEPGDIVATGTPAGVGFARTPPRFLRPGDLVEVEISGIGILRNPVVAER